MYRPESTDSVGRPQKPAPSVASPVIAAVDGSENGNHALEWALAQARLSNAALHIVHARLYANTLSATVAGEPSQEDPVLRRVRATVERREALPPVEYLSLPGAPEEVLPQLGDHARLMVLGARGRGGFASLLLGSNGLACAGRAACPVVVVPRAEPPLWEPHGQIVLGVNGTCPDAATTAFAFQEASRRGAKLQVVTAYSWPGPLSDALYDEEAAEQEVRASAEAHLRPFVDFHPEVPVELLAAPGDAAGHLVSASQAADLVVIGRHRHRPLSAQLGSVTNAVLLHANCPVAVIPPAEGSVPTPALPAEN
ncbi:universal stress protein [Streptomyces sp. NPDC006879]|uniref:universal stress protein n=1 Tax=Streptomyces sp. NPDC006879 TaxID=3364767 RepID=UPI0036C66D58